MFRKRRLVRTGRKSFRYMLSEAALREAMGHYEVREDGMVVLNEGGLEALGRIISDDLDAYQASGGNAS